MCVFGTLGVGKSAWLSLFAKNYVDTVGRKVLIADPSNASSFDQFEEIKLSQIQFGILDESTGERHAWTTGIRVLRNLDWQDDRWIEIVSKQLRNCCVIMDETRVFMPKDGKIPFWQLEFLNKHRNACIDLMIVSHNLMSLHKDIRLIIKVYFLFPTGDKPQYNLAKPRVGENWFEMRSFPSEMYHAWLKAQQVPFDNSKIIQHCEVLEVEFPQNTIQNTSK